MDTTSSLRIIGGIISSAVYPLLLIRVLARGNIGVSTTSQVLHLFVFLLRYPGVELHEPLGEHWGAFFESIWIEAYLIPASVLILFAIRCRSSGSNLTSSNQRLLVTVKESIIYIILSALLAYRINYASFSWSESWTTHTSTLNWLSLLAQYFSLEDLLNISSRDAGEVAWAASIFLAASADIPQYITYYRHSTKKIEGLLMSIMAMTALAPLFNVPFWVTQITQAHSFDYIAFAGTIVQAFAFWMFFVLVVTKVNDSDSDVLENLEAQMEEYDAMRWGSEVVEPLRPRDVIGDSMDWSKATDTYGNDSI